MAARGPRRWLRWVIAAAVVVVVLAVAGPFIFFHFVEGNSPAPLSLKASATPSSAQSASAVSTTGGAAALAGSWQVGSGSQVGYRVQEILMGQQHTAVGRSSSVTGQMVIKGTHRQHGQLHRQDGHHPHRLGAARRAVRRPDHGRGQLSHRHVRADQADHLAPVPAKGTIKTYTATGRLTLHGHSVPVTFPLKAERTASGIEVQGSIPVLFSKWDIPNPSFTGFVTTQNHGVMEFLLDFRPG